MGIFQGSAELNELLRLKVRPSTGLVRAGVISVSTWTFCGMIDNGNVDSEHWHGVEHWVVPVWNRLDSDSIIVDMDRRNRVALTLWYLNDDRKRRRKGKKERMKAKVAFGQLEPEEISEVPANDQTISIVDPETTRVSSPEKPSRERKKKENIKKMMQLHTGKRYQLQMFLFKRCRM